jgi:hypothetical protein
MKGRVSQKIVLKFKHIPTIVGESIPTFLNVFPLWKLNGVMKFWGKKANNKWCPNWNFFKLLKILWNVNIKYGLAFFIWKYEALVMVEKWLEIKLTI